MTVPVDLHLYVHVPFCRYRCDYCDFYTRTTVPPWRQSEILRATVDQTGELLERWGSPSLSTLYIGGGTPSALHPDALDQLLRLINTRTPTAETTVELNPEDISRELLDRFEEAGVNRFSIGIQSFREHTLRRIGRHTSIEATRRGLEILADRWRPGTKTDHGLFLRWNADLIAGIPGGDPADTVLDLEEILSFGPDHLSVYELGVEDNTVLGRARRRGLLLPRDSDSLAEELDAVRATLLDRGFLHYEVSNFAHPGAESRHNLGYWLMEPHLGVGPAAVGTLPEPTLRRFTNTREFSRYLHDPDRGLREESLSPGDFLRELLMMGLRTDRGVDRARVQKLAGRPLSDLLANTLRRWKIALPGSGESGAFVLSPENRQLLDRFLRDAFHELDPES